MKNKKINLIIIFTFIIIFTGDNLVLSHPGCIHRGCMQGGCPPNHGPGDGPDGIPNTCDECPWTDPECINARGTGCDVTYSYVLNGPTDSPIRFIADICSNSVTFDCNDADLNSIFLDSKFGVTIKNCRAIYGLIELTNANANTLLYNLGSIRIVDSDSNLLASNIGAISLISSNTNTITSNSNDVHLFNSNFNVITSNTQTGFGSGLITLRNSYFNTVSSNTLNFIIFFDSSFNILSSNILKGPAGNRFITIFSSNFNTITNNIVENSTLHGIGFRNSHNNTVNNNKACFNARGDFIIVNSSGSGKDNTCDTTDGWNDDGKIGCTFSCPSKPECVDKSGNIIKDLTPISELEVNYTPPVPNMAQQFEAANGKIVDRAHMNQTLNNSVDNFENLILNLPGIQTFQVTSGFRPTAYQAHFYEIKQRNTSLLNADFNNSKCKELKKKVDEEIAKHGIRDGVCKENTSLHEVGKAVDIVICEVINGVTSCINSSNKNKKSISGEDIDTLAEKAGLHRPYGTRDAVHYALIGDEDCKAGTGKGNSPINILFTDPLGRRIGFDPTLNSSVNEIGDSVGYSGPGTEPQEILLGEIISGFYNITGIGIGDGPYNITFQMSSSDGEIIVDEVIASGFASLGQPIDPIRPVNLILQLDRDGDGIRDEFDQCPLEDSSGFDANSNGCKDTIEELINQVKTLNLQQGIESSLDTKLQAAKDALTALNSNQRQDAINKLQSFIKEVDAQRENKIKNEEADLLVSMSNNIIINIS